MNRLIYITRRDALRLGSLATFGLLLRSQAQTSGREIALNNGTLRAVVAPDEGATLLAVQVRRGGAWLDVSPNCTGGKPAMKQCSWMMLPYSNRIENGAFTFEGKTYQLNNPKGHAIHGDTMRRAWRVDGSKPAALRCSLRSADSPDFNWPWPVEFAAEFALEGNEFVQRLVIRNRGTTAIPTGFGWHPYYNRTLTQAEEPVLMQMSTAGIYPDTNGNCIPAGPPAPPTADFDFTKPRAIPTDRKFDHCFSGYDGKGSIAWPKSGVKVSYDCSANVTHLVFYSPPDKPWFAVEPAANANNGVNLLAKGDPSHGIITLPAGEELKASFVTRITA